MSLPVPRFSPQRRCSRRRRRILGVRMPRSAPPSDSKDASSCMRPASSSGAISRVPWRYYAWPSGPSAQACEYVLETCTGLGDTPVVSFLRFRERLVLPALTLDEHAPARARQPRFAFAIDITLVRQYGLAAVRRILQGLEVIGVVFARAANRPDLVMSASSAMLWKRSHATAEVFRGAW